MTTSTCRYVVLLLLLLTMNVKSNSTAYWLERRMNLTYEIFGEKKLPSRSEPDWNILYDDVQSIVWNISTEFVVDINSTVFYSPKDPSKRSKDVIFFHHGHSNCLCPSIETGLERYRCQPGCNSSDPKHDEIGKLGYSWWDLYNVSTFFHDLNYDVFIFSMPLKGVNLGPGSNKNQINDNHWWFYQWEQKGDRPIRYFVEPVILTANYALSKLGYDDIFMAGLSGGGWSTTIASAIDSRIKASFPIAGSVPCAMRNPLGKIPGQKWTGDDDEDYEQSCMPLDAKIVGGDNMPGRSTIAACNYTCQYLLAGLESDRFQIQILHEYDSCCFSPHGRHEQMLSYEKHIRSELEYGDLNRTGGHHGYFTVVANDHIRHEVCAQDKTIIQTGLSFYNQALKPGDNAWNNMMCDILHGNSNVSCAVDIEPGCTNPGDPFHPGC